MQLPYLMKSHVSDYLEPEILIRHHSCREDAFFAGLPISIIESWYQREGYVKSMADLIEKELTVFSNPEEVCTFPFHVLLLAFS
jgi:protoheme ferro-lyase